MAVKAGGLGSELIDRVCEVIRERLSDEETALAEPFARQYYEWVPPDELAGREVSDLGAATIAHFRLALERAGGEAKVRVYDPDPGEDGFASPYTLIDIVSPDMPFIVDSVTMEIARQGHSLELQIHPVIWMRRDHVGRLVEVLDSSSLGPGAGPESVLHAEIGREHDPRARARLQQGIERVLAEVAAAVSDWHGMRDRALDLARGLGTGSSVAEDELREAEAFLEWVAEDHFTFLGYREYDLVREQGRAGLRVRPASGLGILRSPPEFPFKVLRPKATELVRDPSPLILTKANSRSPLHRPSQLDYIGVKLLDPGGQVAGEARFLGLYTTSAYRESPGEIPLLRGKCRRVLERAGFPAASHDRKALVEILESYPREALFQMSADDLFTVGIGLLSLGERPRVRLYVWTDPLDRFVTCLVTIPRDRFNTESRERVGRILLEEFGANQIDWALQMSESLLVRVHYIVRCMEGVPEYDTSAIEGRVAQVVRNWVDDLRDALSATHGEAEGGRLYRSYANAFPAGYRSDWSARTAVQDIARIEELRAGADTIIHLYRPREDRAELRCKLYSAAGIALSDVVPTFEHMGARVIDERPYAIHPRAPEEGNGSGLWIYDFGLHCDAEDLERVADLFQEVFLGARRGELEDDGLNGLVLKAALAGREIMILRAVARYLRQAAIPYSDAYMERTLLAHSDIARLLVKLFVARFDPAGPDPDLAEHLGRAMEMTIDSVESLDEDRILRSFLSVFRGMLRTNYYRTDAEGSPRGFLSFKLEPTEIAFLPKPRPRFEIFVYSPRFEGVHLRGGKVARGGLRWSDRPEDFRTEILGLMKAQMVKNALIVPVGAKGGFVLKRPGADGPGSLKQEAVSCYRLFLAGLLDITDNIAGEEIVAPERVVRYDDDDPYLVVAADKGTATFSDIANEISSTYGFWLGDAFASGGSRGYDHKQMGITARGAWESVKRHFRELGLDVQQADFTVVGIGDMSGDVFGNGMLLSRHIKLLAAFNHRHVFLDPDPDPERSFAERRRLFDTEGAAWSDYDRELISEGGGIYERSAKSIRLSDQVRRALGIDARELSPSELISGILKAPVDLLFNGGIGTYVKAHGEAHTDVGDKANDGVRVDGRDLRCRVVGEGGNLGLTQRGRVEYALEGGPEGEGRINTDSIDNVAGVNCSDHEVNIKILLDSAVAAGRLPVEERNELLVQMTDSVAEAVLYGSYTQTQAISLAMAQAAPMVDVHARLIRRLEQVVGLDREIEYLPSEEEISERKAAHRGFVAPELAIVMAYCKIHLYGRLLDSDVPEDDYLRHDLERYFPPPLPERFKDSMSGHRLRREIVATVVANQLVDRAGTTFAFRVGEETGASPASLARAYAAAREVFDMRSFWEEVEGIENRIDAQVGISMLMDARRLVERASRWLVRAGSGSVDIEPTIERYRGGAQMLSDALPGVLGGADAALFERRVAELKEAGVRPELTARAASMPSLVSVFDIVTVAEDSGREPDLVMRTYFGLGSALELDWLRDRILDLPRLNRWQALARAALRDDLVAAHAELTREILHDREGTEEGLAGWLERNGASVERCLATLADIRASRTYDTTTLSVAVREVRALS